MKSLLKKMTAYMLMFVVLSSVFVSGRMEVYADETVAAEGEATEGETTTTVERTYRRLFIAGDSTVCNWDAVGTDIREQGANDPKAGWSEMLNYYINDTKALQIQNGANTGFSIKTYYDGSSLRFSNTNQLTNLLATSGGGQPGDYLIVQFGQSDAKAPDDSMSEKDKEYAEEAYVDVETYKTYLRQYIADATEKQMITILVTPIADWKVDENGEFVSSYADYAQAVRDVAAEEGTLLIDMDKKSREFYATLTEEQLKDVFLFCEEGEYDTNFSAGIEDTENFQIYGAMHMARLIADGLYETGDEWLVDNITTKTLSNTKPQAPQVTVKMNKEKLFTIQWGSVENAEVYFVYHLVDGEWKFVKQTEGLVYSVNTAIDSDNTDYKVVAMNNIGISDDSNVVKREIISNDAEEETTTVSGNGNENGSSLLLIVIIVAVVVIVIVTVVIIVIKKRNDEDEYDEDEYEEDEYEDDEYEDDEYEDDEYEDDEYEDDEYEDD